MTLPFMNWDDVTPDDVVETVVMPDQLGTALQDQSEDKYKAQSASRFPGYVDGTLAGGPLAAGPLGLVNGMFGKFVSRVANADPATIEKPKDLQPLVPGFFDLPLQDFVRGIEQLLSGVIPIGLLSPTVPNLLANGAFDGAQSMVEGEGWTWDAVEGRTSPGCALFTAAGLAGVQLSTPVQVAEGQELACEGWVKWAGVSAAGGSGFRIERRWYDGATVALTDLVAEIVDPSASGGWSRLSDTTTTPAGVDTVCLALVVDAGVSAGRVWFDDAALTKPATSLPQQWISGLVDSLGALGDDIAGALAWIQDLIERLTGRAWSTLTDALGGITTFAGQLGTILSGGNVSTPLPSLVGSTIREARTMIEQIAGIAAGNTVTPINGVVQAFKDGWTNTTGWIQDLIDAVLQAVRRVPVVGGSLADIISEVGGLNDRTDAAKSQAQDVQTQVSTGLGGQMITTGVLDAMEYHLVSYTSSGTWTPAAHTVPSGFEIDHYIVTAYGGGDGGSRGTGGGPGGRHGGRIVDRLTPTEAGASQAVTVGGGGAGAASDGFGGAGAVSKFGSLVVSVPGASAIPTPMGDIASSAAPGDGGDGGRAMVYFVAGSTSSDSSSGTGTHSHTVNSSNANEPGRAGGSSSSAPGGRGGRSGSGWWGSGTVAAETGASGTTKDSFTTGGGGGGGGGASSGGNGQAGANGGIPGGGGGGGGSRGSANFNISSGNGGNGGRGQVDVCAMFRPIAP